MADLSTIFGVPSAPTLATGAPRRDTVSIQSVLNSMRGGVADESGRGLTAAVRGSNGTLGAAPTGIQGVLQTMFGNVADESGRNPNAAAGIVSGGTQLPAVATPGTTGLTQGTALPAATTTTKSTKKKSPFDDYIAKSFAYVQQQNANQRALDAYNAQSLFGQQALQAQLGTAGAQLRQALQDQGSALAGGMANRGLLRSGLTFKEQDKISEGGVQQQNALDQQLTDYLMSRQSGLLDVQNSNQSALDSVLAQLAKQFASQNKVKA